MKHLRRRCAVQVFSILESIQHPLFLRLPCENAGFDGAEIGHDELAALFGYEHRADELREDVRGVAVDALDHIEAPHLHQIPCLLQRGNVVLGEVLQLDVAARIPTCAACAVELEQSSRPSVHADTAFRRLVLLDGAFGHLESELQHIHRFLVHTVLVSLVVGIRCSCWLNPFGIFRNASLTKSDTASEGVQSLCAVCAWMTL